MQSDVYLGPGSNELVPTDYIRNAYAEFLSVLAQKKAAQQAAQQAAAQ